MNNNDIFKKLRVALMLRDDQIAEILQLVDFRISKAELSAFFRNADHPNYVECGDQVLRNFLNGLVIYLRGTKENPKDPKEIIQQNRASAKPKPQENKPTAKMTVKSASSGQPKNGKPGKKSSPSKTPKIQVVEKVKFNNGKNKKS